MKGEGGGCKKFKPPPHKKERKRKSYFNPLFCIFFCIGLIICSGWEIQCLPYAEFFRSYFKKRTIDISQKYLPFYILFIKCKKSVKMIQNQSQSMENMGYPLISPGSKYLDYIWIWRIWGAPQNLNVQNTWNILKSGGSGVLSLI